MPQILFIKYLKMHVGTQRTTPLSGDLLCERDEIGHQPLMQPLSATIHATAIHNVCNGYVASKTTGIAAGAFNLQPSLLRPPSFLLRAFPAPKIFKNIVTNFKKSKCYNKKFDFEIFIVLSFFYCGHSAFKNPFAFKKR